MANEKLDLQLHRWREGLIDLTRRSRLLRVVPNPLTVIEVTTPARDAVVRRPDGLLTSP